MGMGSVSGLNSLPWCLWASACGEGFRVGESWRARENSLESGSGLIMSIEGGDWLEGGGALRGGEGGFGGPGKTGRSARSFTLVWLQKVR